jgi:isopentenyl diphosphate isomerase/L-lactate dehydrogenase-like FMN-dependent dehydrogenase
LTIDSGVRRGSDVIVALCLGAQFVFFGRPTLYGVAAYGAPGAAKVIDIVRREIDINLAQLGCTDIAGLGPHVVTRPPDTYRISENSSITWHQAARTTATVRPS